MFSRIREYKLAWALMCRLITWSDKIEITRNGHWLMAEFETLPIPITEAEAQFLNSFRERGGA